jgi:GTP-binding protein LepA
VLVVDASQGIEAQTLANLYLALDLGLEIIPVINKVDLPAAHADDVAQELEDLLGIAKEDMIKVSAKTGLNVEAVLEAVVERVKPPVGDREAPLQALIFDSHYDVYKGVIAYMRVINGRLTARDMVRLMSTQSDILPVEIGMLSPRMKVVEMLEAGEVGYVATGLKTVQEVRVGDTVTTKANPATEALEGFHHAKPMVFAGFYPVDNEDYPELREALD